MEDSSASSFQLKRREKRKEMLHSLLSDIRADFEGLKGGMQGLVELADKLHSVDRAMGWCGSWWRAARRRRARARRWKWKARR